MSIDSIKSAGLANGELLSSEIIEAVGERCADKKVREGATEARREATLRLRCVCALLTCVCARCSALFAAFCSHERPALHG